MRSRVPDRVAIIDEAGSLTWERTHRRSNALARALRDEGVEMGDGVAIMCRNHRYFIEATMACAKLGAVALYLNTAFAGPQLADVLERENPAALIYDQEFTDLLSGGAGSVRRFVAWEEKEGTDETTLEQLISSSHGEDLEPPSEQGRYIILTSGTTGTPKGAQRSEPEGLGALAALFSKIPRRYGETAMIAAPLFHSWGFLHFMLSLPTAATMVLRPKFDPEDTLQATAEHRARVLAVVPVMMQRILALPDEVKRRYDLSALEVTAASGSALPGDLATKWMDEFGDNLYNLYGSTEVAWATIATPEDMRAAPGTAGRPAARDGDPDRRRGRQRRRPRGDRPDLHRQPARLRGLYRRRRQGASRRTALLRRRRSLRRGRPPLHRRPRRRDDRLRAARTSFRGRSRTCSPTMRRWPTRRPSGSTTSSSASDCAPSSSRRTAPTPARTS